MASTGRRRLADDDLLKGFGETGPGHGQLQGFFAVAVGGSLYAWDVAFELGAYHSILYYRRHQLLVLSMVALLGGLIMRRRAHIRPWLLVVFTPPILLILLQLSFPVNEAGRAVRVVDEALIVVNLVVSPILVWVVARLLAPGYLTLPDRRSRIAVVVVVASVALVGFLVGHFNDRFLTCQDFKVAGNDEPVNCVHGKHR
jgi:4-amino-4-deoxy-L-arabinose transferase-like glycosyltransferase